MSALFCGIRTHGGFRSVLMPSLTLAVATIAVTASAQPTLADTNETEASVLLPSLSEENFDGHWDGQTSSASIDDEREFTASCSCCDVGCIGGCGSGDGCQRHDAGWANAHCEPPGLLQRIVDHHAQSDGCWVGRTDALILWRNAPPDRPLLENSLVVGPLLNANGMNSEGAAGPRFSILRVNKCTGHAIEATYLRAANFRSLRPLAAVSSPYTLAAPGIFGNTSVSLTEGDANLGSRLQSFELNRHHCHGRHLRFLAGFRWIEWQEQFTLQGTGAGAVTEFFQTNCFNDLYGGQIGLDANLLATSMIRFDGVVKAGAYYNNAVQSSQFSTSNQNNPGTVTVAVGDSPLSGAFAGEVGFTGVVPITTCLDFRFGYFGLWLSGIAQPTQQLSGQTLRVGQPAVGTINANGGVVVQGVSLGLEGRW